MHRFPHVRHGGKAVQEQLIICLHGSSCPIFLSYTFTRESFLVIMHEKGQWLRFPANPWFALFLLLNERHRDWAVSGHNQVLLSGKQFSMPAALKNFRLHLPQYSNRRLHFETMQQMQFLHEKDNMEFTEQLESGDTVM